MVLQLLAAHGLEDSVGLFAAAAVQSVDDLLVLTDEDLQRIGVHKARRRRRLLRIFAAERRAAEASARASCRPRARPPQPCVPGGPAFAIDCHPASSSARPSPATVVPELACDGLVSCREGYDHTACIAAPGVVLCLGQNDEGQLGTAGGREPQQELAPALLPWPAAAVTCGDKFTVAASTDREALCSWGNNDSGRLGRGGDPRRPAEVVGLPPGDPVVILEAGGAFVIAVTAGDLAYGWGDCWRGQLALGLAHESHTPVAIPRLSGLGLRRVSCGSNFAVGETGDGRLVGWGAGGLRSFFPGDDVAFPAQLHAPHVHFPLRGLAAGTRHCAAADDRGWVWLWGRVHGAHVAAARSLLTPQMNSPAHDPARSPPVDSMAAMFDPATAGDEEECTPEAERAEHVAVSSDTTIVLSEVGEIWDCGVPGSSARIPFNGPVDLPLGLTPCGGCSGRRVLLVPLPDCCARQRELFAVFQGTKCGERLPLDLHGRVVAFLSHAYHAPAASDDSSGTGPPSLPPDSPPEGELEAASPSAFCSPVAASPLFYPHRPPGSPVRGRSPAPGRLRLIPPMDTDNVGQDTPHSPGSGGAAAAAGPPQGSPHIFDRSSSSESSGHH